MKKFSFILALIFICISGLIAQEEETSSIVSPEFGINIRLADCFVKQDTNTNEYDNQDYPSFLGSNIYIGLNIHAIELLEIIPTLAYTNDGICVITSRYNFTSSHFDLGLGFKIKPIEDLFFTLYLGYTGTTCMDSYLNLETHNAGTKFNLGLTYNLSKYYFYSKLENLLTYEADLINRYEKKSDNAYLNNNFNINLLFNFFDFIKEGLHSGIYFDNYLSVQKQYLAKAHSNDTPFKKITTTVRNQVFCGLFFNPVEYFTGKFGIAAYNSKSKTYNVSTKDTSKFKPDAYFGLDLETVFMYKNAKLSIKYNPYFSIKEAGTKVKDKIYHKISAGFSYNF